MEQVHADSTGVCRFCGQIVNIMQRADQITAVRDEGYWATRGCECPQAQVFRRREIDRENAQAKREEIIARAHAEIEAKFGDGAPEYNRHPYMQPVNETLVRLIKDAAVLVHDEIIETFSVSNDSGMKTTIKRDPKTMAPIIRRRQTDDR